jgi:hypothetical protein
MTSLLDTLEWHDLPVTALSITEQGISLTVTPFDEATQAYVSTVLRIEDAATISLSLAGSLSGRDLAALEVSSLSYASTAGDRISGQIGLLPGGAGFWEISFTGAKWSLSST